MIEAAIHHRWGAVSELSQRVPADRFLTGSHRDDSPDRINNTLPAASLTVQGSQRVRTNKGYGKRTTARIQIWVQNYADGVDLRGPMDAAFENSNWTAALGEQTVHVLSSRIENDYSLEEDDGAWQFVFDLEFLHAMAPTPPEED